MNKTAYLTCGVQNTVYNHLYLLFYTYIFTNIYSYTNIYNGEFYDSFANDF